MFRGKPVIGILGGIGSGKSYVARIFGHLGCCVIDSDEAVWRAYELPEVRQSLKAWWGSEVLDEHGRVNRRAIAEKVFGDADARKRLEGLLHPIVAQMRDQEMASQADNPQVLAYVWDTPLIVETGLSGQCDALVFVDASEEERLRRVQRDRGWDRAELEKREKCQSPLDNKRKLAKYVVRNIADADEDVRRQVREVLSRILAEFVH